MIPKDESGCNLHTTKAECLDRKLTEAASPQWPAGEHHCTWYNERCIDDKNFHYNCGQHSKLASTAKGSSRNRGESICKKHSKAPKYCKWYKKAGNCERSRAEPKQFLCVKEKSIFQGIPDPFPDRFLMR